MNTTGKIGIAISVLLLAAGGAAGVRYLDKASLSTGLGSYKAAAEAHIVEAGISKELMAARATNEEAKNFIHEIREQVDTAAEFLEQIWADTNVSSMTSREIEDIRSRYASMTGLHSAAVRQLDELSLISDSAGFAIDTLNEVASTVADPIATIEQIEHEFITTTEQFKRLGSVRKSDVEVLRQHAESTANELGEEMIEFRETYDEDSAPELEVPDEFIELAKKLADPDLWESLGDLYSEVFDDIEKAFEDLGEAIEKLGGFIEDAAEKLVNAVECLFGFGDCEDGGGDTGKEGSGDTGEGKDGPGTAEINNGTDPNSTGLGTENSNQKGNGRHGKQDTNGTSLESEDAGTPKVGVDSVVTEGRWSPSDGVVLPADVGRVLRSVGAMRCGPDQYCRYVVTLTDNAVSLIEFNTGDPSATPRVFQMTSSGGDAEKHVYNLFKDGVRVNLVGISTSYTDKLTTATFKGLPTLEDVVDVVFNDAGEVVNIRGLAVR